MHNNGKPQQRNKNYEVLTDAFRQLRP